MSITWLEDTFQDFTILILPCTKPFFPFREREQWNVIKWDWAFSFRMFCFPNVFSEWHGVYSQKKKKKKIYIYTERKSYTPEIKLIQSHTRVTLENCKNISSASRKFKMDRKRIREYLKQEEKIVNQKCRSNQMTEVVLRGFHWWYKHCTMIIKRHGIKGKQSNVGGLIAERSSLLKNFF